VAEEKDQGCGHMDTLRLCGYPFFSGSSRGGMPI